MKKNFLLILLLMLIPFNLSLAAKTPLGHILWDSTNKTLTTSPEGVEFNGQACSKRGISGCNVCTASGGKYLSSALDVAATLPDTYRVAQAFNVYSGTITFERATAYECNNGAQYNVMNVYLNTTEYYSLRVNTIGNGRAWIAETNTSSISRATTGSQYNIVFEAHPGSQFIRLQDGTNPNAHIYPSYPYPVEIGTQNKVITVVFGDYTITPNITIYNLNNEIINSEIRLSKSQFVKIQDDSTFKQPSNLDSEKYGSNPHRIWRKWDIESGWIPITRTHIEENQSYATATGISIPQGEYLYNSADQLISESFYYYIPSDEIGMEHAFQIVHSAIYDNEIQNPNDATQHKYASSNLFAPIPNPDEGGPPPPPPSDPDFKIFYTDTSNTIKDVTDKNWNNSSAQLTVTLKPDNLSSIDISKISWSTSNNGIVVTPQSDGTAVSIIPTNTLVNFDMQYNNKSPKTHWTKYNDGNPPPGILYSDFAISHNNTNITDKEWIAEENHQTINLIPDKENLSSYYWEYMNPSQSTWTALPNGQESKIKPSFTVTYNQLYKFKLTTNKGTSKEISYTHHTIMLPPNNPLKVDISISSPAEYNVSDVPDGELVYITPITLKLTPNFPENITLDNTWHWQIWLTGQNNLTNAKKHLLVDADKYSTDPNNYVYTTQDDTQFSIPDTTYLTYANLPVSTTEITIPYWRTDKDPGRRIIFDAHARLVCSDGRVSDYDSATSFTLLINNITSTNNTYKEYITSINNLTPEINSSTNQPVFEAGTFIDFTSDISQTNSINVSANKDILAQSTYSNSGTSSKFKTKLALKSQGDYDNGVNYNTLTITGNHINATHSATQNLNVQVNWYFPPTTSTQNSVLKIISVRDLRWQHLYNTNNKPSWGVNSSTGNTVLLPDTLINGGNISNLKKGYAVEFELKVTDVFANYLKDTANYPNAKITISTNSPDPNYSTITLSKAVAADTRNNKFLVKHSNDCKTWTFIYYIPPTSLGNTGIFTVQFKSIIASNGKGSQFNWMDLAKGTYGWYGKVFKYDLTRSNLEDIGNNAN